MGNHFPYRLSVGAPKYTGRPRFRIPFAEMTRQESDDPCMQSAFSFYGHFNFGWVWLFFLTLGAGFCLLVSSLHQPGCLLLLFLAPSGFLLPFLECFTCHKTSFSVVSAA